MLTTDKDTAATNLTAHSASASPASLPKHAPQVANSSQLQVQLLASRAHLNSVLACSTPDLSC